MTSARRSTHAVQMNSYGPPEVLAYTLVQLPPLGPDEVRIRTIAAAVNHTDLEIRAGHWPIRRPEPFPYIPGVEVLGEVEEVGASVKDVRVGDRVITMMQGSGRRPGRATRRLRDPCHGAGGRGGPCPPGRRPLCHGGSRPGGVTAYEGLRRIGPLAGRRILVTGAAGGWGRRPWPSPVPREPPSSGSCHVPNSQPTSRGLGAEEVVVAGRGETARIEPGSIDGVLDTVGAAVFEACLAALRPGGVLSLVGAVGGSEVRFDLWDLIRPVTLTGYSSESLDGPALRQAVAALAGWLRSGAIAAPAWTAVPLAEAAQAHAMLERRGVTGRVLLVP